MLNKNWPTWVRVIVEILIVVASMGIAYGILSTHQDDNTKAIKEIRKDDNTLMDWRIHLNDYLEYKDPTAKAFLEHQPGDPPKEGK